MYKTSSEERKTLNQGIRFKPSVYAKLRELAQDNNKSVAGYIEKFINEEYIKIKGVD